MTDIFQPLDLTVNRSSKSFFKRKFTQWYSSQIQRSMESGKGIDELEVKLNLKTLKPLHAAWIFKAIPGGALVFDDFELKIYYFIG